jgi:hypothetical protein
MKGSNDIQPSLDSSQRGAKRGLPSVYFSCHLQSLWRGALETFVGNGLSMYHRSRYSVKRVTYQHTWQLNCAGTRLVWRSDDQRRQARLCWRVLRRFGSLRRTTTYQSQPASQSWVTMSPSPREGGVHDLQNNPSKNKIIRKGNQAACDVPSANKIRSY